MSQVITATARTRSQGVASGWKDRVTDNLPTCVTIITYKTLQLATCQNIQKTELEKRPHCDTHDNNRWLSTKH